MLRRSLLVLSLIMLGNWWSLGYAGGTVTTVSRIEILNRDKFDRDYIIRLPDPKVQLSVKMNGVRAKDYSKYPELITRDIRDIPVVEKKAMKKEDLRIIIQAQPHLWLKCSDPKRESFPEEEIKVSVDKVSEAKIDCPKGRGLKIGTLGSDKRNDDWAVFTLTERRDLAKETEKQQYKVITKEQQPEMVTVNTAYWYQDEKGLHSGEEQIKIKTQILSQNFSTVAMGQLIFSSLLAGLDNTEFLSSRMDQGNLLDLLPSLSLLN